MRKKFSRKKNDTKLKKKNFTCYFHEENICLKQKKTNKKQLERKTETDWGTFKKKKTSGKTYSREKNVKDIFHKKKAKMNFFSPENTLSTTGFQCVYGTITPRRVFTGLLYLFVDLSAALHKNYLTDFHETWMEALSQPRTDPADFCCRSWWQIQELFLTFFNTLQQDVFCHFDLCLWE